MGPVPLPCVLLTCPVTGSPKRRSTRTVGVREDPDTFYNEPQKEDRGLLPKTILGLRWTGPSPLKLILSFPLPQVDIEVQV